MNVLKMTFCFSLISIAALAGSVAADTEANTSPHHHQTPTRAESPPWKKHLKAFEILIEADSEAAPTELAKVAQTLFGTHALVDEWKTLYLRLSRDKKGSITDLKRAAELVILMLTDIDAEKHQEQIQRHQKRFKYYETLTKQHESKGESPDNVTAELTRFQLRDVWMDDIEALDQHIKAFNELLPKDKKAARIELDAYAKIQFGEHPLVGEWTDIIFQMSLDGKGKLPTYIRMCKMQLQMYREINAEKYADQIVAYTSALNELEATAEMAPNNNQDLEIEFSLSTRHQE